MDKQSKIILISIVIMLSVGLVNIQNNSHPEVANALGIVPSDNLIFAGDTSGDFYGTLVTNIGDVNGDNVDDIAVTSPNDDLVLTNKGTIFVYFGNSNYELGPTEHYFLDVQSNASFSGVSLNFNLGYYLAGLGDFNNDVYDDFAFEDPGDDTIAGSAGQVFVIFGGSAGRWANGLSVTNANISFVGAVVNDLVGRKVAGIGDVNNDNFDVLLIS